MKLSALKEQLKTVEDLRFLLPDGTFVPRHFHITEMGQVSKHFIDCGGTVRKEKVVSLQLWYSGDTDHRLAPAKLSKIIDLSEKVLGIEDAEIEVEYQNDTIGKYGLEYDGVHFLLVSKNTACLASDQCGSPGEKEKLNMADLSSSKSCCAPTCCS